MKNSTEFERFIGWLEKRLADAGKGSRIFSSDHEPAGRFWLGRLASEASVVQNFLGARGERLEPCAAGIRLRCASSFPIVFKVGVKSSVWLNNASSWTKHQGIDSAFDVSLLGPGEYNLFEEQLTRELSISCGASGLSAKIRIDVRVVDDHADLDIVLVNTSPDKHRAFRDTRLYETELTVTNFRNESFSLTALPESYRYNRNVDAYGINCGVTFDGISFRTADVILADKKRPNFWGSKQKSPDFSFIGLAADPFPSMKALAAALNEWGDKNWSKATLEARAKLEHWTPAMLVQALSDADEFWSEYQRLEKGIEILETNPTLLRSFVLMNNAMARASLGRGYDSWRPFQVGFMLCNLVCIQDPINEAETADIVWFATGGGKTETYLGLLITAALYDRLTGKGSGISAWTRFPLRMLSLQQLQRFADAMAAAELVRQENDIKGDTFSVGFLVGQGATPNTIPEEAREGQPDPDDENMPERYRVLQRCPFCGNKALKMEFDRKHWRLNHRCDENSCAWGNEPLPFFVVDDEIYRFLPTVVVGTLDKAAQISMQSAMRGFVAGPLGLCPQDGHGFTYSVRSRRRNGCLVPGCPAIPGSLPQDADRFAPSYRLQDELHLLRDSLGAVDAHYEALLDGLQLELSGRKAKILGSSATLKGYEQQVDVLYRRKGRVFPVPPPSESSGFWTSASNDLMRRFVGIAPRGLTIEFVIDRLLTELQTAIREINDHPLEMCKEIGIDASLASAIVDLYGTNVVYGNTLRDLDAVDRSLRGDQVKVNGPLNRAALTGRTEFEEVRNTLERLEKPEVEFSDRIHVVTASAMMSHGVDIDRLNIMLMVGLPLGTAEFIQATARVGRRYPGLVFVIHKIGRERDASVYRSFRKFIEQGDRFVEPVPITRKSRRVLDRTIAGLELARLIMVHEPTSGVSLATLKALRDNINQGRIDISSDPNSIVSYLGLDPDHDLGLIKDIKDWYDRFFRIVTNPLPDMKFPGDASPSGKPMMSLRDVEEQVPIHLER
jgi:hypothetical protein